MSTETDLAGAATATDLVPGQPGVLNDTAALLQSYAADLAEAAQGFVSLSPANWSGQAADTFRATFAPQPARWQTASDAFAQASRALGVYATSLLLAQDDAADALTRYRRGVDARTSYLPTNAPALPGTTVPDPGAGDRHLAVIALDEARGRVRTAGTTAHNAVRAATDAAPEKPGWWQTLTTDLADLSLAGTVVAYDDVLVPFVNGVASVAVTCQQNPGLSLTLVGGALLTLLSGGGEGVSAVLVASGVGAPAGSALATVSTAGVVTGVGVIGGAAAAIGYQASQQNIQIVHRIGGEGRPRPEMHPYDGERPSGVGKDWHVGQARDKKGIVWQRPGALGDADQVRFKDPDARYPYGSVRFYNEDGQPIDLNGKPSGDDKTHIPINADGSYPLPQGWNP